jgi:hypothetical protein
VLNVIFLIPLKDFQVVLYWLVLLNLVEVVQFYNNNWHFTRMPTRIRWVSRKIIVEATDISQNV